MKNNILVHYKKLNNYDRSNLSNYLIYDGIFTIAPSISKEDALFLFKICQNIENKNINLFSVAHYITDNYMSGYITKNDLEKATSGDICSAVYFDKLDYLHPKSDKQIEEELEK